MSDFGTPALLDLVGESGRAVLERLGNRASYQDGEFVHHRGDTGNAMCVVISGQVSLHRMRPDGLLVFVSSINAGQNFGDTISIVGSKRSHHAVAVGHTVIDHYSSHDLDAILRDHPEIVLALYRIATYRVTWAVDMLDDARMLKSHVRLAKMLRRMAVVSKSSAIVPTAQDVLCQVLGLSSVSVVHALGKLARKGLIETGYRRITIPDIKAFDAWLGSQDWE